MSSNTYSACLTPDRKLRFIVIASGRLLAAIGFLLIVNLPLDAVYRLSAVLIWGAVSVAEMRQFHKGYAICRSIRLRADGTAELLNRDSVWVAAQLQNGSMLLQRAGWLRFKTADGSSFAELLTGDCRQSQDWRRLQVIWRHIGAAD